MSGIRFFPLLSSSDPGTPTGAKNGLSLAEVTGEAVLGQNAGAVGNPAVLLSDREIPLNDFDVIFLGANDGDDATLLVSLKDAEASKVELESFGDMYFGFKSPGSDGYTRMSQNTAGSLILERIDPDGLNGSSILVADTVTISPVTNLPTDERGILLNGRVELMRVVVNGDITPYPAAAFFGIHTNAALAPIVYELPLPVVGQIVIFYCDLVAGISVTATGGATIRRAASVTAANGTINSVVVGSCITLECVSATKWIASAIVGTWT